VVGGLGVLCVFGVWGRKYAEKGDAYVAESPEQAVCYALEVFKKNQNISNELLSL